MSTHATARLTTPVSIEALPEWLDACGLVLVPPCFDLKSGAMYFWADPAVHPNAATMTTEEVLALAQAAPVAAPAPSGKARIPLPQAVEIAGAISVALKAACARFQIAGSIRRREETIGDVEFVAISDGPRLHTLTDGLLERGQLQHRLNSAGQKCWGKVNRRAWWVLPGGDRFALDIFFVTPEQWGGAMAIRTGCGAFSHALVTSRLSTFEHGGEWFSGLRPHPLKVSVSDYSITGPEGVIPTPEEKEFFKSLELPCFDPALRTPQLVRQLGEKYRH